VITLLLVIYQKAWQADFVAILRDHVPFYDLSKSLASRFCRYFA